MAADTLGQNPPPRRQQQQRSEHTQQEERLVRPQRQLPQLQHRGQGFRQRRHHRLRRRHHHRQGHHRQRRLHRLRHPELPMRQRHPVQHIRQMHHRLHGRLPHPTAGSRTARGRVHIHPPHSHHGRQDRRPVLRQGPDRQRDHHRHHAVGHQSERRHVGRIRFEHEPDGHRRRFGIRQLGRKTARHIHPKHVLHERFRPHVRTLRQRHHRTLAGYGTI